jgi:hypothetical protein
MRRKNPAVTLALFLAVMGFGYAAYQFLVVEKVFAKADLPPPPRDEVERIKAAVEEALASDSCFVSVTAINWRPNASNYRIDVQMVDGCEKKEAQRITARVSEIVRRATNGLDTEVWVYALGREVYHRLP